MPINYATALRGAQTKAKSQQAAEPCEEFPVLGARPLPQEKVVAQGSDLTAIFQDLSLKVGESPSALLVPKPPGKIPATQQAVNAPAKHQGVTTPAKHQAEAFRQTSSSDDSFGQGKAQPKRAPQNKANQPQAQIPATPPISYVPNTQRTGPTAHSLADVDWRSAKPTPEIPDWKEDALNKASKAVYKGKGFKAAAQQYNVTIADLRHYYDQHFRNDDGGDDDDDEY